MLALPLPYPLTEKECLKRGIIFYAPLTPDRGARPLRLGGIASPSAESVDAVGTYVSARDGLIHPALANVLRIERKGGLIEGARYNENIRSQEMNNASWAKTQLPITTNSAVAPDGTTTAETLADNAVNDIHQLLINGGQSVAAGAVCCWSGFFKNVDRRYVAVWVGQSTNLYWIIADLQTGAITTTGDNGTGSYIASGIENYGNGWYRIWIVGWIVAVTTVYPLFSLRPDGTSNPSIDYGGAYIGDGSSVYAWGAQFEEGARFPSSYIPTGAVGVTRAKDTLVYDNTGQKAFKAAQGTIFVAVTPQFAAADIPSNAFIFTNQDSGDNKSVVLYVNAIDNTYTWLVYNEAGVVIADLNSTTVPVRGTRNVLAAVWDRDNLCLDVDGVEEASDTGGTPASTIGNNLRVGVDREGGSQWFGNIARLIIFDRALSAQERKGVSDSLKNWG